MRYGERYPCLFCLTAGSFELRADSKGRPYFCCTACGARTFLRGLPSLRGPSLLWEPLAAALMRDDAEAARVLLGEAGRNANARNS